MVKIVLGTEYMSTNLLKSEIRLILVPKSNEIVLSTYVHEYKAQNLEIWFHQTYLLQKRLRTWVHEYNVPKIQELASKTGCVHAYMCTKSEICRFGLCSCTHVRAPSLLQLPFFSRPSLYSCTHVPTVSLLQLSLSLE